MDTTLQEPIPGDLSTSSDVSSPLPDHITVGPSRKLPIPYWNLVDWSGDAENAPVAADCGIGRDISDPIGTANPGPRMTVIEVGQHQMLRAGHVPVRTSRVRVPIVKSDVIVVPFISNLPAYHYCAERLALDGQGCRCLGDIRAGHLEHAIVAVDIGNAHAFALRHQRLL